MPNPEGAEGAADPQFAAILHQAADVDAAAALVVTGKAPEATEVIDPVEAWAEIPALVGQLLSLAAPELKDVYNPKACRAWGESMHKLAQKRGWSADGLPPEVGVACTSAMFVIPTVLVFKMKKAQADARKKAAAEQGQGGTVNEAAAAT